MRSFLCPYNQVRFKLTEISAMMNNSTPVVFKVLRSIALQGLLVFVVCLACACTTGPIKPAPINERSASRHSAAPVEKPIQSVAKVNPVSNPQVSYERNDAVKPINKENKTATASKGDPNKTESNKSETKTAVKDAKSDTKADTKKEAKVDKKDTPDQAAKIDATVPDADFKLNRPATGQTIGSYNGATNKGIDIAGKLGDPIYAASEGKVIFADNFKGYGNTLIVQHGNRYVTVYAHNKSLLVKEGQQVKRGQKIAEMGDSEAERVKLHFEIRRDGKPVDPSGYLQ